MSGAPPDPPPKLAALRVGPGLEVDGGELHFSFVRAPGPGGQNVNKVATAVVLRFDVQGSPSLPERVRERAMKLAGSRLTREGEIVLHAHRHRTRERNRQDAVERLRELLRQAAAPPPKARRKTKPSRAARERRLAEKRQRGASKRLRGRVREGD